MHLLIPFAACNDPASRLVLRGLRLPHLEQLLARLTPLPLDTEANDSPVMPHERALARALGLRVQDPIPWAALQARAAGFGTAHSAWACITPCHWQVGQAQVTLDDPEALALPEDESRALLAAMQPYFEEDGITLFFENPARWLAQGEVFRNLATASPERVIGRDLAPWLPAEPALRRLQTEMQMLLYTHPVNEARIARGLLPVNSFWISGSGALDENAWQVTSAPCHDAPRVIDDLQNAALRQDWSAWGQAWQQLDATEGAAWLAALVQGNTDVRLTLCGERSAQTFTATRRGLRARIAGFFRRSSLSDLLEPL